MSWDLFVMDLPADAVRVDDIPDDFRGGSLGARADLIRKIQQVVPASNFSDPSWGLIEGPDFSIEVNIGKDGAVDSFAFHVRGSDLAIGVVADILGHLGLRAVDPQSESGSLFTPESATESPQAWRRYRDSVINRQP